MGRVGEAWRIARTPSPRRGPSLSGKTMEVLYKGETAIYLEQSSVDSRGVTWYNVRTDSGAGWVSSKYATVK